MPVPIPPKSPKKDVNWGRLSKTLSFWLLILLIPVALIQLSSARTDQAPLINYTQYRSELERDNIRKVKIQAGKYVSGEFKTPVPYDGRNVPKFNVHLPMERAPTKRSRSCKRSSNSCVIRRNSRSLAGGCRRARCSSDPRARARRCSRAQWPAKRGGHSSRCPVRIS